MAARKGRVTAGELAARLAADPVYQERFRLQEEERRKRSVALNTAQAPLVAELTAAGKPVHDVWDLVGESRPYPELLPILLKHLGRAYPDRVREGIARALAVPDSRPAWGALVKAFKAETAKGPKDGLACALGATMTADTLDEYITLLRDPRHGSSRVLMIRALARARDPRAKMAMLELSADPVLAKEVAAKTKRRR